MDRAYMGIKVDFGESDWRDGLRTPTRLMDVLCLEKRNECKCD